MADKIKGITIEFKGNATPLNKAIREVNSEIGKTTKELSAVNKALKFNPSNVDLWKQKQELLTKKIGETETKLSSLKQAQAQMDASGVEKNSKEYRELEREIIETESKLKTFKAELKAVGNVKLKALSEEFKQVGSKISGVGKELSMKVTAPLAAIGGVAAKGFADVDKTMQLTYKTMGTTKEEADLLNQAMKDAAANSTFGMNDAAQATLNFARAGLSAKEAAEALAPAMNLSAGEGGDLDTVSAGLVATINGFGDSFDKTSDYADVFANACNNSALDVDSLSTAMSVAAPIFRTAGYNVKDAALYLGVMADNGIDADKAANSLKTGIARLVSPAKKGAEAMDDLGISVTNADGTMKDTLTIQRELHDTFKDLSEAEQIAAASAIFGKNQMAPWLALINTAPDDVAALNKELQASGTTVEMAEAMMSGFGGSLEKLKSSLDVAKVSLGEALAPMILKVANGIQKLIDWFNNLSPSARSVIATIGVIVAAIGPLLVIIGTVISAIGTIIGAVATVSSVIAPLGAAIGALATGPIGLIIAAIAAVIAIGVLLYKNWDVIKAKAIEIGKKLKEIWTSIKTSISTAMTNLKTTITTAWDNIKTSISTKMDAIKTKIAGVWDGIKTKIDTVIESIKTKVSGMKESISAAWDNVKEAIKKAAKTMFTWMTWPYQKAWEGIQKIIDWIKNLFPIDIKEFFSKIKLPHIKVEWSDVTAFGKTISFPSGFDVEWYKNGGIFSSPSIIGVGEAGSEAVVPLDKFWDKLDNMAAGTGVTINVYASPGMNEEELARKVEQKLVQFQKQRTMAYGGI